MLNITYKLVSGSNLVGFCYDLKSIEIMKILQNANSKGSLNVIIPLTVAIGMVNIF